MTPRGTRQGLDAEDLDVEEALALVKDGNGPTQRDGNGNRSPSSHAPQTGHRAAAGEHRHQATPWPEARTIAAVPRGRVPPAARQSP